MKVISMNEESLLSEYYEIFHTVNEYDKQLMTVKGWGVTLSLAALAWGFQYAHFGLFLVAALSGLGFWLIEGTMKRHQMRYYLRMREIEVLRYESASDDLSKYQSSPRIDSSWSYAGKLYSKHNGYNYKPEAMKGPNRAYQLAWFFPHVFLPHAVSVVAGLLLLYLGMHNLLGKMTW
ncbi:MAG: hypothetical protein D6816_05970 [Bacteroidetes bacterium]|nr:MAG: hypothetical protein D6816_05970 [Bacteroidota bacterium]